MKTNFSNFLIEAASAKSFSEDVLPNIKNNLEVCITNNTFLFRGASSTNKHFGQKNVKRTRRWSATGNNFSLFAFSEFFKEFPDRFKSTFVSNSIKNASSFGEGSLFIVIPYDEVKPFGEAFDDFNTDANALLTKLEKELTGDPKATYTLNNFTHTLKYLTRELFQIERFYKEQSNTKEKFDSLESVNLKLQSLTAENAKLKKEQFKTFCVDFFKLINELYDWWDSEGRQIFEDAFNPDPSKRKDPELIVYLDKRYVNLQSLKWNIEFFIKLKEVTDKEFNSDFYQLIKEIYSPNTNKFKLLDNFEDVIKSAEDNNENVEYWFSGKYAFVTFYFLSQEIVKNTNAFAPLLDKYNILFRDLDNKTQKDKLKTIDYRIYREILQDLKKIEKIKNYISDFFKIYLSIH